MGLPLVKAISLDEFYKLRENSERLMEFVDGVVYTSPSPSTKHQRISGRLNAKLFNLLETKECEVFQAPFDVELCSEKVEGNKVVIPDLLVICDKSGLGENKYVGVPGLIIEIVSPSNQAHDLVFKLNLYMQYGVKEYWIINPMLNSVQLYSLRDDGQYDQADVMREKGKINSLVLQGFTVDLEELFG